jgi:hypothetical protein
MENCAKAIVRYSDILDERELLDHHVSRDRHSPGVVPSGNKDVEFGELNFACCKNE